MNTKEKILNQDKVSDTKEIVVSHVTVRQSITVLLLKLLLIELIAASIVILFHSLIITTTIAEVAKNINNSFSIFNIWMFSLLVLLKTALVLFVIIQWLNEYYEITPKEVIYRKGFLFVKEERHRLDHLGSMKIEQGFWGRLFNYGTVVFFNWELERNISLYLIHNPLKYHNILKTLLPEVDTEKKVFKERLTDPDDT